MRPPSAAVEQEPPRQCEKQEEVPQLFSSKLPHPMPQTQAVLWVWIQYTPYTAVSHKAAGNQLSAGRRTGAETHHGGGRSCPPATRQHPSCPMEEPTGGGCIIELVCRDEQYRISVHGAKRQVR